MRSVFKISKFCVHFLACTFGVMSLACKTSQGDQSSAAAMERVRDVANDQLQTIAKRYPIYRAAMPFTYTLDGCYARGLLMSADLSVMDIPVEVVNQSVTDDNQPLRTSSGVEWNYHTAPQFYYKGARYVIDPAHAGAPLPLEEWKARNNVNGSPSVVAISTRNNTGNNFFGKGVHQLDPNADLNGSVNGAFNFLQLVAMTEVLAEYIGKEKLSPDQIANKRKSLAGFVQGVVQGLSAKGRLSGQPSGNLAELNGIIAKAAAK